MEQPALLSGIRCHKVQTDRLLQNVYFSGDEHGTPVIFLHGNFSSALYWEETMLALPQGFWGIAPDLRGYGWTEDKLADSTRGMREWSDDIHSLLKALNIQKAHFVGWSMGAGVIYRFIADYSEEIRTATLICPVSPYGFGGSKGADGQPCYADFAGSGGGIVNPTFIKLIQEGDRGTDDPNSPRNVINTFYYKPPFHAAREEDFLTGALAEKTGSERYPGDFIASQNWPNVAPGKLGPVNAWSPKYLAHDVAELLAVKNKPPILWVRGDSDLIVSDQSMFDFGTLGSLGYVPGWPGMEVYPPQPMITQTRSVFERYAQTGGSYGEHVIADAAHGCHLEKPAEFNQLFHAFIA